MIPKIIHYCWFGNNEKPEVIKKCIESWQKFCPDYEIIEWNESNFDINMYTYVKEAYEAKKWAFVSDVARLWVVYTHGGIYMDTDVEFLDSIDDLLKYKLFISFESERSINTGLGFGAEKNNQLVKKILDDYKARRFKLDNGKFNMTACPSYNTQVIVDNIPCLKLDGSEQCYNDYLFVSCGHYNKLMYHYWSASWTDTPNLSLDKKGGWKDTRIKRFLRKPERVAFLEKHLSKRLFKMYIFIAYDLQEFEMKWIVEKIKSKLRKNTN
ncbi:MAG: glycosyltransferase [Ruminococcus sp.]|nr:glycosyltransferase [Ruminococcus sp.]